MPKDNSKIEEPSKSITKKHDEKTSIANFWKKGILGTSAGIFQLIFSLFSMNVPAATLYAVSGLSSLLTLYLGKDSYLKAAKKLWNEGKFNKHSLYSLSTLTVVGVSTASYFIPWLPTMFEAGPLILGFMYLGEAIEHSLKRKVTEKLKYVDYAPKEIEVNLSDDETEKWENVSTKKIQPGQIIRVLKGQTIPLDGICLNESTQVITELLSGSKIMPKRVAKNATLLAGMVVPDNVDEIKIKVTKNFEDSYLSRKDKHLSNASKEKAPIEIITNKILNYFVPAILAISLLSGISLAALTNPAIAIQCAISVLVSACPCALGFITPLAIKIGMKLSADLNAIFKNGKTLQALEGITTFAFDYNGTLTIGEPRVTDVQVISSEIDKATFLRLCQLLEKDSKHQNQTIANTICNYVEDLKLEKKIAYGVENKNIKHHSGIKGDINGQSYIIGNVKMLEDNGVYIKPELKQETNGKIFLAKNGDILGYLIISDPLRSDAKPTIEALKKRNIDVHIISGADQKTIDAVARELNIPPENAIGDRISDPDIPDGPSKEKYINEKLTGRKVAFVGDGGNDSEAMTQCLGIAMGAGDEITQQNAGLVIQNNSLETIIHALNASRATNENIKQNLAMSLTYNSLVTAIASGLFVRSGISVSPGAGVAMMILESLMVLGNALRFKHQGHESIKNMDVDKTSRLMSLYQYVKQVGLLRNVEATNQSTNQEPSRTLLSPM